MPASATDNANFRRYDANRIICIHGALQPLNILYQVGVRARVIFCARMVNDFSCLSLKNKKQYATVHEK